MDSYGYPPVTAHSLSWVDEKHTGVGPSGTMVAKVWHPEDPRTSTSISINNNPSANTAATDSVESLNSASTDSSSNHSSCVSSVQLVELGGANSPANSCAMESMDGSELSHTTLI